MLREISQITTSDSENSCIEETIHSLHTFGMPNGRGR